MSGLSTDRIRNPMQVLFRRPEFNLSGIVPGSIRERWSRTVDSADEVWSELGRLGKLDGWLQTTDMVFELRGEVISARHSPPLDAELALAGDHESVHLRHLGESSWQIVRLRREDGGEGWIVPGQVIKAKAFGRPPGENDAERLLYEVEWQLVEDPLGQSVLRPFRARFAGFRSMGGR